MMNDLWRPADQFPLGKMAGLREVNDEGPGSQETRPFGLKYVTDPNLSGRSSLNVAALYYDCNQQIAVMRDGESVLPAFKHTNNQTSTTTADSDRTGPDSDTDVGND
jgi:putative ATP-grasp target RiPP